MKGSASGRALTTGAGLTGTAESGIRTDTCPWGASWGASATGAAGTAGTDRTARLAPGLAPGLAARLTANLTTGLTTGLTTDLTTWLAAGLATGCIGGCSLCGWVCLVRDIHCIECILVGRSGGCLCFRVCFTGI